MCNYVYIKTDLSVWTVGFYDPAGKFQPESDHATIDEAAERVRILNGGVTKPQLDRSNSDLRTAERQFYQRQYRAARKAAFAIRDSNEQDPRFCNDGVEEFLVSRSALADLFDELSIVPRWDEEQQP